MRLEGKFFWRVQDFLQENSGFPGGSMVKNPCAKAGHAGDLGSILEWGRSPGKGSGNPLQYSCLENPMDTGACQATIHGVTKSQIQQLNNNKESLRR